MMTENCQLPANVKHDKLITNNVSLLSKLQTHKHTQICTISGHYEMWHFGMDPVMPGIVCYGSWLDFDVSP